MIFDLRLAAQYAETLLGYLLPRGVRCVLCQKLVHPTLRHALRRAGVFCLERLGAQQASPIVDPSAVLL